MMANILTYLPWWAWGLVANLSIAVIEYLNRVGGYANPIEAFKRTGLLIIVAQIGLFYAWRDAPTFLTAWMAFYIGNLVLRTASSHFFVGELLTLNIGLGVCMVAAGGYLIRNG